uniref:RING-type domain-containing protein n=1 Tax=Strongyloides venezuelensis TaxID=75913 RepID=A0A0K0FPH1_STRVS
MDSLFCNSCFTQPSGITAFYYTKCLHIFCETCLNTTNNKRRTTELEDKKCLYCGEDDVFYHKIDKSISPRNRVQFYPQNSVICNILKVDSLRSAAEVQENKLKSMVKVSQKYDNEREDLKKKFLMKRKTINLINKMCLNKVNEIKKIDLEIKKMAQKNREIATTIINKKLQRRAAAIQVSKIQSTSLISSEEGGGDETKSKAPQEHMLTPSALELVDVSVAEKEASQKIVTRRQGQALSKSFFDTTNSNLFSPF